MQLDSLLIADNWIQGLQKFRQDQFSFMIPKQQIIYIIDPKTKQITFRFKYGENTVYNYFIFENLEYLLLANYMKFCKIKIHDHSKYTIQQRELEIIGIMSNKIYLKEFFRWNRQNNIKVADNQELKTIHADYQCKKDCYLLDNSIVIQITDRRFFLIQKNQSYIKTIIQHGGNYFKAGHNTFVQIRKSNNYIRYYKRLSSQCKQIRIFTQTQKILEIQVSDKFIFIHIYGQRISYYIQLSNAKILKLDLIYYESCLSQNGQYHVFIKKNALKQIKLY